MNEEGHPVFAKLIKRRRMRLCLLGRHCSMIQNQSRERQEMCHKMRDGGDYAGVGTPEDGGVWASEVNVVVAVWPNWAMAKLLVDVMIEALAAPRAGLADAESDVGVVIGRGSWLSR